MKNSNTPQTSPTTFLNFKKPLYILLSTLAASSALALLFLYRYQNKLIYLPSNHFINQVIPGNAKSPQNNPYSYKSPSNRGLIHEQIEIQTQDNIKLKGWLVLTRQPKNCSTLIYFHQNAGNIGFRIPLLYQMNKKLNCNILLIAYRGFSDSQGQPNQTGIKIDGLAILHKLVHQNKIDNNRIFLYGRSLGGAVASYVATNTEHKQHIKGMILQNTFYSMQQLIKKIFGNKIGFILNKVLKNRWDTYDQLKKITNLPILFIKGQKDELIPISHMQKLQNVVTKANKIKPQSYTIPKGTHNQMWTLDPQLYFEKINCFIKKYQKNK